ncbi:MAG: DUF29 family protein [Candidatus Competibacteraceae bacterium]
MHRLAQSLPCQVQTSWQSARLETGLPVSTFPETCPYAFEQAIASDFLPD